MGFMNHTPFFSLSMCFDSSGSSSANAVAPCTKFFLKKKDEKIKKVLFKFGNKVKSLKKNSQYSVLRAHVQLSQYHELGKLSSKKISAKNVVLQKRKAQ